MTNADADSRRAAARPVTSRRGRDHRLLVALAGYVTAIVASALAGGLAATAAGTSDSIAVLLVGQVAFWSVLAATVLVADGARVGADALAVRFRWPDLPVGALAGIATQLVLVPAIYLPFRGMLDEDDLAAPARDLLDRVDGAALVVMAVSVIVVAPLVEELFFRGLLLDAMRRRWNTAAAVVGSSVVFGATHFQPLQFPALTLAGAVFAVAAVRTGRLGAAVAVHAGFNATTFVALVLLA